MSIPPISEELVQAAFLAYYGQPNPAPNFRVLHLDGVSMTLAWHDASGRVEAKFLLKEQGPELLWSEVH